MIYSQIVKPILRPIIAFYVLGATFSVAAPFVSSLPEFKEPPHSEIKPSPQRASLVDAVLCIYRCEDPRIQLGAHRGDMNTIFSKDVRFIDPAVRLFTSDTVIPSTNALIKKCSAQSKVLEIKEFASGTLVRLDQQWTLPVLGTFNLKETLWIEYEFTGPSTAEREYRIKKLRDMWNNKVIPWYFDLPAFITGSIIAFPLKFMYSKPQ